MIKSWTLSNCMQLVLRDSSVRLQKNLPTVLVKVGDSGELATLWSIAFVLNSLLGKLHVKTALRSSQLSIPSGEGHSATTMSSYQTAFDEQKRASQEMAEELEKLKRKLSSAHRRDAEADAVRKERYFLREAVKSKQQHVEVLMTKLAKAQMTERAVSNTADTFEARLEMANAQKNDVLEENHELRRAALSLHNRERIMKQELSNVYQQWHDSEAEMRNHLKEADQRASDLEGALRALQSNHDNEPALVELNKHIQRLEEEENSRNQYILRLEQELRQCRFQIDNVHLPQSLQPTKGGMSSGRRDSINQDTSQDLAGYQTRISELKRALGERDMSIKTLETERDRITILLHSEIRAKARNGPQQVHPANSALSASMDVCQTLADVQKKARVSLTPPDVGWEEAIDPVQRIAQLESEIDYHVKDIVLYKLDVKGYKKDIKRANAKIQRLQGLSSTDSPNLSSISDSHRTSSVPPVSASSQNQPPLHWPGSTQVTGLGIFTPEPSAHHPPRKDSLLPPANSQNGSSSKDSPAPTKPSRKALHRTPSASPSLSPQPKTPSIRNKGLPRIPLTPPASKSPLRGRSDENVPAVPKSVEILGDRPGSQRMMDAPDDALTPVKSVAPSQAITPIPETSELPRIDRSLSESVVEALSGSPAAKGSLSLFPHQSVSRATGAPLVGGKKSFQKLTGRRSKSATAAMPSLNTSGGKKAESGLKDGEKVDSGVEVRS